MEIFLRRFSIFNSTFADLSQFHLLDYFRFSFSRLMSFYLIIFKKANAGDEHF